MTISANILANIFAVAAITQTPPPSAPNPGAPATPAIAIKESPRARVAYLPHTGAYWSIGPSISRVRSAQETPAPIFVRYNTDPRKVSPAQLNAEIGFVLDIGKLAPQGFQAKTQPSQIVAYMTVETSRPNLARNYQTLEAWARQNGYQSLGPVIEHYPPTRQGASQIEIQLEVQKAKKTQPPPTPESQQPIIQEPTAKPTEIQEKQPKRDPAPTATTAKTPKPNPKATQQPTKEPSTENYNQLALRIIPEPKDWSPEQTNTLGSKIMRIRTIAHLAKSKFGKSATPITNLSVALTDRYTKVCETDLTSAVTTPNSKRPRRVIPNASLEQLDRIFSDLLTGNLDANAVQQALLQILQEPAKQAPNAFGPKLP